MNESTATLGQVSKPKECSVSGCGKKHHAKGLCSIHRGRMRRYGDLTTRVRNRRASGGMSLRDHLALFATITPTEDCILWRGSVNATGYGDLVNNGKRYLAHRAMHLIHVGPIPDGHMVRHSYDNPPCVNPRHLSAGTAQDNTNDMLSRGRKPLGEQLSFSKLTADQVIEIRKADLSQISAKSLAEIYGVSARNISAVRTRRSWKHLGDSNE